MPVVFFGTPPFSVPSLNALLDAGEDVAAVVTRPDKRRGRGERPSFSALKEAALSRGLRVLQPVSVREEAFLEELRLIGPEFIVVVAFGRILPVSLLEIPKIGAVNLHASLLPRWRGASPMAWAIISGDKVTGLTTMLISEGLDEGDILLAEPHDIREDDTTGTLARRLSEAGAPLLARTLRGLREGTITPMPQRGEATFAPPFKKQDGLVDWSKRAVELYNFIRGMQPWPGAFFRIDGLGVKLIKARALPGEGRPGVIEKITGDSLAVGTGGGLLEVVELQPEGKRPMSVRAFLQGRKISEGIRLAG